MMLLGLTEPTSGSASVLGLDPTRAALDVKRRVGYLPDAVGFYGRLTGRENLRYTAALNGLAPDEAESVISDLLGQVGLRDVADRPSSGYSRGMLQRLGIADALVKDPALLILDEPTTAIDPAGVAELLALVRRLAAERGVGILLSSHLLAQVERLCDRVGIFWRGRLLAEGTAAELAERAGEPGIDLETTYGRIVSAATEQTDVRAA
jgi:ABC-2 type transport system ATP-binding protein